MIFNYSKLQSCGIAPEFLKWAKPKTLALVFKQIGTLTTSHKYTHHSSSKYLSDSDNGGITGAEWCGAGCSAS